MHRSIIPVVLAATKALETVRALRVTTSSGVEVAAI